ncbi:hypothetical protein RvY_01064, partial [Ramazzottius varieornatus]
LMCYAQCSLPLRLTEGLFGSPLTRKPLLVSQPWESCNCSIELSLLPDGTVLSVLRWPSVYVVFLYCT